MGFSTHENQYLPDGGYLKCERMFTKAEWECIDVDTFLHLFLNGNIRLDSACLLQGISFPGVFALQTFAEKDTDVMDVFVTMTLAAQPDRLRRRSKGFAISLLLHCLVLTGFALVPVEPQSPVRHQISQYSVQLLQLSPLPPLTRQVTPSPIPPLVRTAPLRSPHKPAAPVAASAVRRPLNPAPEKTAVPHRQFVAPADFPVQPVKQTLVRSDVPPNVRLKEEVPLPTLMLQKLEVAPVFRRQFVAPASHRVPLPTIAQVVPAPAPELKNPAAADVIKVAPVITAEMPRLPVPPPAPSPVHTAGTQHVPELKGPPAPEPAASNLDVLSLPANPITLTGLIAIPPANQIAGTGEGNGSAATEGPHGQGEAPSAAASGTSPGRDAMASASTGRNEGGAASSVPSGSSTSSSAGGSGTAPNFGDAGLNEPLLPGTSRIILPKQGTFNVVVLGSTASQPYPESTGVLSGRTVYTVYLHVGLRKNWILQYCLPKSAMPVSRVEGTRTPLEAPWPYLMIRPDQTSDSDYVLVRGSITAKGRFDQLALVFPQDLEKKDLLLRSLGQWEFRPASRDGVPIGVEILLIIPREE